MNVTAMGGRLLLCSVLNQGISMKAVILAGGLGTRLSEETSIRPKPMVEVGGMPILWHIMKIYSTYNINDFIICCGYKGEVIKEFFLNYSNLSSDITVDLRKNSVQLHNDKSEPWKVTLVDTGHESMTGGRIRRVKDYIGDETFCLSYGDGVCDLNIDKLIEFHKSQQTLVTLTAVQPPGRYGSFSLRERSSQIRSFHEKPDGDGAWVNGGYFVVEPEAIDYIDNDLTTWEQEPLQTLAQNGQLSAFKYSGFWQSMDTLRDRMLLEELWESGNPPWRIWA